MSQNDDPVPPGLHLSLDEVFRVLEALEDALATVIRLVHVKLGLDEGGVR